MPSRLNKMLARRFMVSWREQPNRYDIEALQDNIRRVGLVVRVRWVLIAVLIVYSVIGAGLYVTRIPVAELATLMWIPALALGFVLMYNAYYSLNYRRLGNIAVWNQLQLLLDILVVTLLVYFSGGVNSWFWSMYSLFILEGAFILPRSRDAWSVSLACVVLLGLIEWLEFAQIIPHMDIPFAASALHQDVVFVAVRYLWQVAVLAGTAGVSVLLVGEFRRELSRRTSQSILDSSTGLYSRNYLLRALPMELRRAGRDGRPLHLMLLDIDRFGEFNSRFGLDRGDLLLGQIAEALRSTLRTAGDEASTTNIVARIGGEEFAILLVEDERLGGAAFRDDAKLLAEAFRSAVARENVDGAGVTVSIGVATFPDDGTTAEMLMDAADSALMEAVARGGNQVVCYSETDAATTDSDLANDEGGLDDLSDYDSEAPGR